MRVAVLALDDPGFLAQLAERAGEIVHRMPRAGAEMIIFHAATLADLDRLVTLRDRIAPDGTIWVVHPKGKGAPFKDTDVMAAGKRAGLVDVKVAAFSATLTATKLVVPRGER